MKNITYEPTVEDVEVTRSYMLEGGHTKYACTGECGLLLLDLRAMDDNDEICTMLNDMGAKSIGYFDLDEGYTVSFFCDLCYSILCDMWSREQDSDTF